MAREEREALYAEWAAAERARREEKARRRAEEKAGEGKEKKRHKEKKERHDRGDAEDKDKKHRRHGSKRCACFLLLMKLCFLHCMPMIARATFLLCKNTVQGRAEPHVALCPFGNLSPVGDSCRSRKAA